MHIFSFLKSAILEITRKDSAASPESERTRGTRRTRKLRNYTIKVALIETQS